MLIGDVMLRSVDNDVEYKDITITNLDTGEKRTYGDCKITREDREKLIDNNIKGIAYFICRHPFLL